MMLFRLSFSTMTFCHLLRLFPNILNFHTISRAVLIRVSIEIPKQIGVFVIIDNKLGGILWSSQERIVGWSEVDFLLLFSINSCRISTIFIGYHQTLLLLLFLPLGSSVSLLSSSLVQGSQLRIFRTSRSLWCGRFSWRFRGGRTRNSRAHRPRRLI